MNGEVTPNNSNKDDMVLWIVISFCLLAPVIMASFWAYKNGFYPPMLLSVLLGIAASALTYRYLGGAAGAEFSIGVLKVAGSAAILFGITYIANENLSKQMDIEISANKNELMNAKTAREEANNKNISCQDELTKTQHSLESINKVSTGILISEIEKLSPKSQDGQQLIEMARNRQGPFAEESSNVNVTVISLKESQFQACINLEFANKSIRFSRLIEDGGEVKSVSAYQIGTINQAICDRKLRKFDVQISCQDGLILFPEQIEGCDKDGAVKWRNADRVFPIMASILNL